ncbi:MAG: aminoacyl-tRNA hydrolase [Thermoleophilia bacterium]|nr:aminoacyl-tRNA hydrolase [Thermoleophilia bacterium]
MSLFRNREAREDLTLLAGLGNPGEEYALSRHNAGFMVASFFMRRHRMGRTRRRYGGRWCEGVLEGHPVAVLLPQTYMNLSGEAVAEAARKKHVPPERIIVVHDDLDFPFGTVRCRLGGGAGGHKGLESVTGRLGTPAYNRVRLGIGRPDDPAVDPRDWVLSPFEEPNEAVESVLALASDCVETIITDGIETAMSRFNRRQAPEPPRSGRQPAQEPASGSDAINEL